MHDPRGWIALAATCALGLVAACADEDLDVNEVQQALAPVNQLPPPQTTNEDSPLFFSSGGGNALTVSDADNTTGTVQITVTNGTFVVGSSPPGVTVSGSGSFSATVSGPLTGVNSVNTALNNSHYQPTADYNGPSTLSMNSSDNNGEFDLDVLNITVTAFNDPPVNNVPPGAQTATEDVPRAFTLSVSDIDIAGAPILVTLSASNATLITLPTITGLSFTVGDGSDDPGMTFSGLLPDVNAALNGLVVTAPLNYIGGSTLVITSNDQGASGAGGVGSDNDSVNISWSPVNDPPVNATPAPQTIAEAGTLTFSAGNGNPLTVSDVDASTALVQVTLTASTGAVSLGNPGLVIFTAGDGTSDASMTFNATLSNLNAALAGTVFTPPINFAGAATLTMTSNDLGNAGAGGARSDTDVVTINVTAVNDAPLNVVPGAQFTNEDVARIFSTGNGNAITVTDPDAASLQVTLTASLGTATLASLTGLSFLAGDGTTDVTMTFSGTIASVNAALNGSRFTPTPNLSGDGSLTVSTSDLGATGTGGVMVDSDEISITITPVNDAPTAVGDTLTVAEDAGATAVSVLANDTALPDAGETLTVSAVGTPLHGFATTDGTTVSYTPAANYNGTDAVGYTISDSNGGFASATLSVTITSVNDDPAASDDSFGVVANSVGNSFGVLSNDSAVPDIGETLTISTVGVPVHGTATIISANTRISYTPDPGYSGPDTFTYTIGDGNSGTDTATVTVDVAAQVTEPVNSLPGPQTIVEDSPLIFSSGAGNAITVADANNTSLTVQILVSNGIYTLGSLAGLTVSGNNTASMTASGTITALNAGLNNGRFTPALDFHGAAALTINSSDTNGETDLDVLTLSVTSFNDAPVNSAPTGAQSAPEDAPRTFTTISVDDVDLEGANLLVTLTANNGTVTSLSTTDGLVFTTGDGTADPTMTFRGTLTRVNVALNGLAITSQPNYIGPSTLVMTSNDQGATGAGSAGADTDTINLTWTAVNDPPINSVPGAQTALEDGALTFSSGNGNALTVSDQDAATVQLTLGASTGTLTLGNPGVVTFTSGDGTADSTMTFNGTLANLSAALAGTIYNPPLNFNGAATVTMVSNDLGATGSGGARTDTDVVTITVAAANDAPLNVVPGAQLTNEDVARVFSTGNGNPITVGDVDATSLQVTLTAGNGTATLAGVAGLTFQAGDGTADTTMTFAATVASLNTALNGARFTPTANFGGAGSLLVSTSDLGATGAGGVRSDDDTIVITVAPINDPPTAVGDLRTLAEDAGPTAVLVLANDAVLPDLGETLTVTAVGTPLHGSASTDGTTVTYTPAADYNGTDSVGYTITDGSGGFASATVSLTITPVNDDPDALDDSFSVLANSSGNAFNVLANDTAAPDLGETLTITVVNPALNGVVILSAGTVSYTPTGGYSGPDTFTYTIGDGNGGFDTATVSVNVVAQIQGPVNALPGPQSTPEDSPLVFSTSGSNSISVSDATNPNVSVQIQVQNGIFTLFTTTGLTSFGGNPSSTVSLSGAVAAVNNALNGAFYTPASNYHGPSQVTILTSDTDFRNDLDFLTLSVTSSNDPPVNTVPLTVQAAVEDTPRTFATVSVTDVDLEGADLFVTLTANNGTVISLSGIDGLVFTTGDGAADPTMSFRGSLPSINVALNGVTITSTPNYIGPSTLVMISNDQGHTGAGFAGEDTDTINLSWAAANDAPVNAVPASQTIVEETSLTFSSVSGTGLSVSDNDVSAGTMQVTLTVTGGLLTLGSPGSVSCAPGDCIAETTMTFSATIGNINAALNGTIYVPNGNFAGAATLTMESNDNGNTGGTFKTDTDIVSITVTGINDGPVNTVPGPQSTNEDTARIFSTALTNPITIVDPDATAMQVTLSASNGTVRLGSGIGSLVFQAGDGTDDATMTFAGTMAQCLTSLNAMRFTPALDFVGVGSVTILSNDLGGTGTGGPLTDEDTVFITVNPGNDPPTAVNDSGVSMNEDAVQVEIDVLANDTALPDTGETLLITAVTNPARGFAEISVDGTRVLYTPDANLFGADTFSYTINDGTVGSNDTATVSLTVTSVNDPPNANDDSFIVNENTTNNAFPVRTNDSFLPDATETLTVTGVTAPIHGLASITGTGSNTAIAYTPAVNYNGPDSLTYTLSDPSGATDTATVTITVNSVSTTPVAVDDAANVAEDGSGIISVLANDTGQGDTPITVAPAGPAPAHGSIVVLGDQTVQYTPVANYNGPDTFGYTLTDADLQTDTGLVTVTVTPTDDTPVAVDDVLVTVEDTSAVVTVLGNDQQLFDQPVTVAVSTPAGHGTATPVGNTISYVPATDYTGNDIFSYRVTDQDGDTSIAQVTITITPVNDPPVAVDDYAASHQDETIEIDVLANDTDAESNTLVVLSVTAPQQGVATINGDNTLHYVPAAGFTGTDSFAYTVSDGLGGEDIAEVDVAVGVDTDGDGLLDVDELNLHGTDPQSPDTDADGIDDGDELFTTMTDPVDDDTDDDGLLDGNEDLDDDGFDDGEETDANNPDTDEDGVQDGTESGLDAPQGEDTDGNVFVADDDPSTMTDPLVADTDGGGTADGDEDVNGNGRIDIDETDPNDPSDDPGPPDADEDGVPDTEDNCPDDFNPNQQDEDEDGVGNKCDDDEPAPGGCCDTGRGGGGGTGAGLLVLVTGLIVARRRRARR